MAWDSSRFSRRDGRRDYLAHFGSIKISPEVLDAIVLTHEELKAAGGPVDASKRSVALLAGKKAWRTVHNWEHAEAKPRITVPDGWGTRVKDIDAVLFFLEALRPFGNVVRRYESEVQIREVLAAARKAKRHSRKYLRAKWRITTEK